MCCLLLEQMPTSLGISVARSELNDFLVLCNSSGIMLILLWCGSLWFMLGDLSVGLIWRDTFFCFLTSLAYGGVMRRLGSIVVVIGHCDGIVVSRFMDALPSGRYVPVVCPYPVSVLTC